MNKIVAATTVLLTAGSAAAEPRIVDQIGALETDVRVVTRSSNPVTWIPQAAFFVDTGGYAREDVVLVEWREGNKPVAAPFPCAASAAVDTVAYFSCRPGDDLGIDRAGAFSLALTYKQPLTGKTHDLGVLRFKVIEIAQGAANRPRRTFTDDRDHQLGLTTLDEHRGGLSGPAEILMSSMKIAGRVDAELNEMAIRFWTKRDGKAPGGMTMACLLGDRKIAEADNAAVGGVSSYWTFKGKEQVSVDYRQQVFRFLTVRTGKRTSEADGGFYLGDHPGDYRCVAMAGGEIVKEVFFTVGADGEIAGTPCDDQARLLRHVHVVRASETAANLPHDEKAGRKSGYFGRVVWKDGCPPR